MVRTEHLKNALLATAGTICMVMAFGARGDIVLSTTGVDGGNINNAVHISGASNPTAAQIATALNATTTPAGTFAAGTIPTLQYKQNFGGSESGSLAGSYQAAYNNTQNPPLVITYTGGGFFNTALTTFLLVKDGNAGSYLWNLTGLWDGQEKISVNQLFPHNGGWKDFSHVEIGGTPVVPEPTTVIAGALLLLPFAASTLRSIRRIYTA